MCLRFIHNWKRVETPFLDSQLLLGRNATWPERAAEIEPNVILKKSEDLASFIIISLLQSRAIRITLNGFRSFQFYKMLGVLWLDKYSARSRER